MRLILPAVLAVGLCIPAAAAALPAPAGLGVAADALLIKVDHKAKHRGKGHGRKHDDSREYRAYREGVRDGLRYSRGQYLPHEYRGYVVNNYDDYGYPPPPYGSRYVQVGQDTYLMQIATGLILNAFLGGRY